MDTVFSRNDIPEHVLAFPELSFAEDLFAERVGPFWIRLGAWTITSHRDESGVEEEIFRQSLLLTPKGFTEIFDKLEAIGNVIGHLGKPGGFVLNTLDNKEYGYSAFHQFPFPFTSVTGEALVFVRWDTAGAHLFINPDLWLFLNSRKNPSAAALGGILEKALKPCANGSSMKTSSKSSRSAQTTYSNTCRRDKCRCLLVTIGNYCGSCTLLLNLPRVGPMLVCGLSRILFHLGTFADNGRRF